VKNELVIEGVTYIKKEAVDKDKKVMDALKKHSYMDAGCVSMLYFDKEVYAGEDHKKIRVATLDMDYELVGEEDVLSTNIGSLVYVLPNGTRVSKEYIKKGNNILCELHGGKKNNLSFFVYASLDEKGKASKDRPVMIGRHTSFLIIAPRVTEE